MTNPDQSSLTHGQRILAPIDSAFYCTRPRNGKPRKTYLLTTICVLQAAHLVYGMERAPHDASTFSKFSHLNHPSAEKSAEESLSSPEIASIRAAYDKSMQHGVTYPKEEILTHEKISTTHANKNKEQQPSWRQTMDSQKATQVLEKVGSGGSHGSEFSGSTHVQSKVQRFNASRARAHTPSGSPHVLQEYGGGMAPPKASHLGISSSIESPHDPSFESIWKNACTGVLTSNTSNPDSQRQTEVSMIPRKLLHVLPIPHMALGKITFAGLKTFPISAGGEVPSAEKIWPNAHSGELSCVGSGRSAEEVRVGLEKQRGACSLQAYNEVIGKERAARGDNPAKSDETPSAKQLWKNAHAGDFLIWIPDMREKESNLQQAERSKLPPSQDTEKRKKQAPIPKPVSPNDTARPSVNQLWQSARAGEVSLRTLDSTPKDLGLKRKGHDKSVSCSRSCTGLTGEDILDGAPQLNKKYKFTKTLSAAKLGESPRLGKLPLYNPSLVTKKTSVQENKKKKSVSWAQSYDVTRTKLSHVAQEILQSKALDVPSAKHLWETAVPGGFLFQGRTTIEHELSAQPSGMKTPESGSQSCNVVIPEGNDHKVSREMIFQNTDAPSVKIPCEQEILRRSFLSSNASEESRAQKELTPSRATPRSSRQRSTTYLVQRRKTENYYTLLQNRLYQSISGAKDLGFHIRTQILPEDGGELSFEQKYENFWDIAVDCGSREADKLNLKESIKHWVEFLLPQIKTERCVSKWHRQWLSQGIYALLFDVKLIWRAFPLIACNKLGGLYTLQSEAWEIYKSAWENFYDVRRHPQAGWKLQKMTAKDLNDVMVACRRNLGKLSSKRQQLTGARGLLLIWLCEISPILYYNALVTGTTTKLRHLFISIVNLFNQTESSRADSGV